MRFPFLLSLILLQLLALIAIGIQSIACEPWRHTVCSAPNTTEFGYVTLLSSDEFLPGAIVLVESLKQTGTNNDIVVMILPHISLSSRTKLCLVGIIVVEIDYIDNPYAEAMVAKRQRYNFSKLRIWQFSHYRRLVFLDSDVLVVQNIDELFSTGGVSSSTLAAVENYNSPYATPPDRPVFNSGMMVIQPDPAVFEDLVAKFNILPSYNGGDQGFLNAYFTQYWTRLGAEFNANKMQFKYSPNDFPEASDMRVIHYVRQKPWYDIAQQSEKSTTNPLIADSPADFEPLNRHWHSINRLANQQQSGYLNNTFVLQTYWTSDGLKRTVKLWPRLCLRQFNLACSQSQTGIDGGMSLAVQISSNRLPRLVELCQEWEGPMSVALFVSEEERAQVLDELAASPLPLNRLDIHLIEQESSISPFPINLLRNIAIRYSRTDLVFLLDVDFQIPLGLYRSLVSTARMDHITRNTFRRHVFIVPAFEYTFGVPLCGSVALAVDQSLSADCVQMPNSKEELIEEWNSGKIVPFHAWGLGHRATDYERWRREESSYYVQWEMWYEPYLIFRKSQLDFIPFDERFVDRSRNKLIMSLELSLRGFQFVVLSDAFVVHQWENEAQLNATRLPRMRHSKQLYHAISHHRSIEFESMRIEEPRISLYS